MALLDNFCWGSPLRHEQLGGLVRAAEACYDMAKAFQAPFISGKDSLSNEFTYHGKTIRIPHTLLITAMTVVPDVQRAITMDAKQAGKIRFIGFTGHKDPLVHLRMLDVAAKHNFRFDTVQMPLNVMDAHYNSFQRLVLPALVNHQIGVLGMKPFGSGLFFRSRPLLDKSITPMDCLHYAMSLPTSVVITGCDTLGILRQGIDAAFRFKPMEAERVASVLHHTAPVATGGDWEKYKTSGTFDGTAQHPWWVETASL